MTTTLAGIMNATPRLLSQTAAAAAAAPGSPSPSLPLLTLQNAFGGPTMAVLQCTSHKYLTGVFTCWSKNNETNLPYARIPCPAAVLDEGTCQKGGDVVVPLFK